MTNKPLFKVKEGEESRDMITVSHQNKEITFVAPLFYETYIQVRNQIDDAKLLRPTFAETISLVHSAVKATYSTDKTSKKYAQEIIQILDHERFWGFNSVAYKPREGIFISDRNRKDVRVPFGFKIGENSLEEFAENPFVLALAEGKEQVGKLVEIAKSGCRIPYVGSFSGPLIDSCSTFGPSPVMATSLGARIMDFSGCWLCVDSHHRGINDKDYQCGRGFAFGLLKD